VEEMSGDNPHHLRAGAQPRLSSSFALAWAEVIEASDIFIGVNASIIPAIPTAVRNTFAAYERMANLATKAGVEGRHKNHACTPR